MGNEFKRRAISGDEVDAYSTWRKMYKYMQRPRAIAQIKRRTHKRERREAKTEIANNIHVVSTLGHDATDPDSRAEGSEAGRNEPQPSDGVIRWCADRGYALDETEQAYVRRWWGVR